nr:MAG: replication polyprotein [Owegonang virus 17]
MVQYRRICFTKHVKDALLQELRVDTFAEWVSCVFAVFQLEHAPSTGAAHYQGYCEFSSPLSLSTIKRHLGRDVHVEKAVADRQKNVVYCTKEESRAEGPWEFIRPGAQNPHVGGGQGSRNDIAEFRDAIIGGMGDEQLWAAFPGLMARYPGMVRDVRRAHAPRRRVKPEVYIFFGAAGTGKSRLVNELAPDAYRKVPGKWWDHYCGEPDVVMDDFYGGEQFPYAEFLKLTDWYDYMAECKGGMVKVNPKRIFITSNRHPREWYAAVPEYDQLAFFRRITEIKRYGEDGTVEPWLPPHLEREAHDLLVQYGGAARR